MYLLLMTIGHLYISLKNPKCLIRGVVFCPMDCKQVENSNIIVFRENMMSKILAFQTEAALTGGGTGHF